MMITNIATLITIGFSNISDLSDLHRLIRPKLWSCIFYSSVSGKPLKQKVDIFIDHVLL